MIFRVLDEKMVGDVVCVYDKTNNREWYYV